MAFGVRRLRKKSGALSIIPGASPEDALEPAFRAVLVASGAAAGAICLYDESEDVLRLVLEVGLSDEGCRRLRRISLGDPAAWIAPLRSLHARRREIFERSSGADVPPLLEAAEAISAVACIPLHVEGWPRASLILVGVGAMELDAANLREADPAVTNVTRIVEAIGRRGQAATGAEPLTDPDTMMVAPATRRRLESLGRPGQTRAPDQSTLADADFPTILTESNESDDREAVDRAHTAELEHLTARLTEAERAWAREHSLRVEQELRYERARRRAETERNETVRRAREFVASAESLRSSAVAEAESIRAALAQAQRLGLEARHAAQRMQAEADAARAAEAAANAERDQLVQALKEAHASATEATSRHHQLEGESATLAAREAAARVREAEVDARWRANLAEAGRVLEHERRRGAEREAERLALTCKLQDTTAREQELRAELDAIVQRTSAEREETLCRALEIERTAEATRAAAAKAELEALRTALGEAQRIILDAEDRPPDDERLRYATELNERTEQARAAAVLELEATHSALAAAQADVLRTRADAGRVREEVRSLVAERQAAVAEVGRLASALEETRAELGETTARAARLEVELDETEVEARAREEEVEARWLARRGELESAATSARARVTDLETDIARQTHELADTRGREAHARELLRIVTEDREGTIARVTELARAAEEARTSATSEAEAIRAALGNAQALIIQAEDEAQRARAESERQEAELRAIQSEREQLKQALEKARAGVGESERHRSPALPHSPARSSSATVPGTVREKWPDETLTPSPGVVAIVGGDDAFAVSPPTGIRIAVLGPEPGLAGRLTQLGATRVVVNLASAGGLAAVASLRAEGYSPPLWGCLAVPEAGAVLPLGRIETAPRSLDPEAVLALLGHRLGGGTRLLAIGTTPDSLLGLRQSLTRAGVSMSIAWDAKQAVDLLAMVRPEVVIVDLALPSRAGYQIVTNLAVLEPQPLIMLLPAEGEDAAAAFAAAFAERSRRGGALSHAKALQTILTQRGAAARRT